LYPNPREIYHHPARKQDVFVDISPFFDFTPRGYSRSIHTPLVILRSARSSVRLFDAHCHLQDQRLTAGLDTALSRAANAGLSALLCCGTEETDWSAVARIATERPAIVPAFGIHPWYARNRTPAWRERLREYLGAWPAAPIGEIGLDHALTDRNDTDQDALFREQLAIAAELERPACIHCRRAWGALLETLQTARRPERFMIHSFSGAPDLVPPLAELGAWFSFSGTLTWSRNRRAHAALAAVPPDRLLIETDAPDLPPAPDPEAGGRTVNEPANLRRVLASAAARLFVSEAELAERTWQNAARFLATKSH